MGVGESISNFVRTALGGEFGAKSLQKPCQYCISLFLKNLVTDNRGFFIAFKCIAHDSLFVVNFLKMLW